MAEGLPAVDNIQNYVWACHLLGYQHPDLTSHAAQVRDWYGSEDGLDLGALDADCAALERAVAATERGTASARTISSPRWRVHGPATARTRRANSCAGTAKPRPRRPPRCVPPPTRWPTLRDELWRAVDGKVAAAHRRRRPRLAQRAEWLAAAQTVTTGAGDRAAASELVDQQVKPFVDNDIRADWLTAMRTAIGRGRGLLRRRDG